MKKFKFFKIQKTNLNQLSHRNLLLNAYITQLIIFVISIVLIFLLKYDLINWFQISSGLKVIVWGIGFALLVLCINSFITQRFSHISPDVSESNVRLFKNLTVQHIIIFSFVVAFCEELLFRGVVQSALGIFWTSIIFAGIHLRYLKSALVTGQVFLVSLGLGWIFKHTGSIWTPILAHFMIDFVSGCFIRFKKNEDKHESK
jgi:membrane protease YdiL (CAAX protease family)